MSDDKPTIHVPDDAAEETADAAVTEQQDHLANIVMFWTERAKVASHVAGSIADDLAGSELSSHAPSADGILQAMSLYEMPSRIVGTYFETQRNLVEKMQGSILQAKGAPAAPPLQKGPRRKRR